MTVFEYWPVFACCAVVGIAAGWASRFVPHILIEREGSREVGVGTAGVSLLLMGTATVWIFGAPPWMTNAVAAAGAVLFLYGFAVMTRVSRVSTPLLKAVLAPDAGEGDVERLLAWLGDQAPTGDDLGEFRGHQAEVALALLAGGHESRAAELLADIPDDKAPSVGERTRLLGSRAVLAFVRDDPAGVDAALEAAKKLKQDFVSTPHLRGFVSLLAALRGQHEDAFEMLGERGAASGSLVTDRWARINALVAAGRKDEARTLLEAQRNRHGVHGVVPLIALRGPAEELAREALGTGAGLERLARAS